MLAGRMFETAAQDPLHEPRVKKPSSISNLKFANNSSFGELNIFSVNL